jgi:membrane associated rhomboid family serine protease
MRQPPPISRVQHFPVTGGVALLAIIVTIVRLTQSSTSYSTAALEMSYLAFHGQPWRLLTSALPHAGVIHLFFNLSWLWILGSLVEERFGHVRTLALYVLLAAGSSAAEYAFAIGGVGLSGVVYGIFGMLWVLGRTDAKLKDAIDAKTIRLFVGWFFFCIVMTVMNIFAIANYAHGAGLILGVLVGWIAERRPAEELSLKRLPATVGLVVFLAATFWAATAGRPLVNFSRYGGGEVAELGYYALLNNENEKAARLFQIATSMRYTDPNEWLDLGIAYHRLGRFAEAQEAFRKAGRDSTGEELPDRLNKQTLGKD